MQGRRTGCAARSECLLGAVVHRWTPETRGQQGYIMAVVHTGTIRTDQDSSHLLEVVCLEECVAGLQLDRTDHKTSNSFSSVTSG